jgi:adenylate kinase
MDKGLLVPDDVILGLIEEVLGAPAAKDGIIMDGFPRTVPQAEAVGKLLAKRKARVDHVLNFDVPDDELVTRMQGRAKAEGRADDTPEAFQQRLKVYRKDTAPLIDYYKQQGVLTAIPATGAVEVIAERVTKALA